MYNDFLCADMKSSKYLNVSPEPPVPVSKQSRSRLRFLLNGDNVPQTNPATKKGTFADPFKASAETIFAMLQVGYLDPPKKPHNKFRRLAI